LLNKKSEFNSKGQNNSETDINLTQKIAFDNYSFNLV